MNELIAKHYDTMGLIKSAHEKTAEEVLLDELVKTADENGIDLDALSDEDIAEILQEVSAGMSGESEKTAGDDTMVEKLAEADTVGRTMAHAFFNELSAIGDAVEKTASDDDYYEDFEDAATARANEILEAAAASLEYEGEVKQSSDYEVDAALTERALELIGENDYDVDAVLSALGE